ncbi:MAG: AhpC/TSA family protein [Bacteroidetes bacterium]|nr:AhpC/TSA family protein [Bacteroidota bacterium]
MKFVFFTLGALLSLASQAQKDETIIEGTIIGMPVPPAYIYRIHPRTDPRRTDSAAVKEGKYRFIEKTDGVTKLTISRYYADTHPGSRPPASQDGSGFLEIYVNKGDRVTIISTGTMKNAVVSGSRADHDYHEANHKLEMWGDTLRKLYKMAQETKNAALLSSFLTPANVKKAGDIMDESYPAFIRQNPSSPIDLTLISTLADHRPAAGRAEMLDSLYQLLPAATRSSKEGLSVSAVLNEQLKTEPGHKAIDFTQTDADGNSVSLSSFKGKYVLLNFWASWDADATAMLASINSAQETYGSKGLVVLGVSLDADKSTWLQAIEEQNMKNTTQVSDLHGKDNAVARLYGITKLPRMLLIDPSGTIVASRIDRYELNQTLTSVFE